MSITFDVAGEPKPQGSKRAFVTKHGKAVLVESAGEPLKDWRTTVTVIASNEIRRQTWTTVDGPVSVTLNFRMKEPARPKHPTPAVRPDLDKLVRAVLDALTSAGVWMDDSQVVNLTATKTYGQPGVEVTVCLS